MTRYRFLLALAAACLLSGCYYDSPPYPGASYRTYGSGYNTRAGYNDPWNVGYTEPYRRNYGYSGFGYGHSSYRYRDHDHHDDHDDHKKSSSSSHKKSSSSSSQHKSSGSSSNKGSSSSGRSKSKSSSGSSRAAEWQKDKGGNPRAKRGS